MSWDWRVRDETVSDQSEKTNAVIKGLNKALCNQGSRESLELD